MNKKMTSMCLPENTITRLKQEASNRGISMAEMVRRILDNYFDCTQAQQEGDKTKNGI